MFSRTSEYALRVMTCLAQRPHGVAPTPALARQTGVPENYLAKVLQQLAAAGLVVGRRGVGGGYRLRRPGGDVRLIEIVRAVSDFDRLHGCPNGPPGAKLCALHRVLDDAARAAIVILDGVTLGDLVRGGGEALCGGEGRPRDEGGRDPLTPTIAVNGQHAPHPERTAPA
ncbi:MAG: Rrf2 family transcriptional regulator [Phycisphaerales bacterium]|nr:Rrf2 family transcriptional regulator [Phycisphaerales bacterium]